MGLKSGRGGAPRILPESASEISEFDGIRSHRHSLTPPEPNLEVEWCRWHRCPSKSERCEATSGRILGDALFGLRALLSDVRAWPSTLEFLIWATHE